ncbi:MAG: hypothetical protein HY328_14420 [Chloroflexi bacterium]|nr:hypothetical protein [Chloroflexota bacterium]
MHHSTYLLVDDGSIPNHPSLPLLVYQDALPVARPDPAAVAEETFRRNGWGGIWRNGIYPFHHYHSTAHEVLAVVRGWARVQLGGAQGVTLTAAAGTVLVLPAGTGHKRLDASPDLLVVGAYPPGQTWDLCRGTAQERAMAFANIRRVPLPLMDPIYGETGPLVALWLGNSAHIR